MCSHVAGLTSGGTVGLGAAQIGKEATEEAPTVISVWLE